MKYKDIVMQEAAEAIQQLQRYRPRSKEDAQFTASEKDKIKLLSEKLVPLHKRFLDQLKEFQDEYKGDEYREKEIELLMVDIELEPVLEYSIISKASGVLSVADELFLRPFVKDWPEESK